MTPSRPPDVEVITLVTLNIRQMSEKKTVDYHPPLYEGHYYHVFNRTNKKGLLFREEKDRVRFFKGWHEYLLPYMDIFVYSLLGNHFHLLIRVKSVKAIGDFVTQIDLKDRTEEQKRFLKTEEKDRTVAKLVSHQFLRFFTSYSMYYNGKYSDSGNLMARRFKRIEVEDSGHLFQLIRYIHRNAEKHGLVADFRYYKWSSYLSFLSNQPTKLAREEVLEWFESMDDFLTMHHSKKYDEDFEKYIIED